MPNVNLPIGWAKLNGGVTGGAGGPCVVVSTYADFVAAVADHNPRIVQVSGMIANGGTAETVPVGSNKTIFGLGSNSGIRGFGLNISGWRAEHSTQYKSDICEATHKSLFDSGTIRKTRNVIIRNMLFDGAGDDLINVQCYSENILIDHNTFQNEGDGAVDMKRGSNYLEVAWNKFVNTDKTMLLGHDSQNGAQDRGTLNTTYHHNWFSGSRQRIPRVRFAKVHFFNNWCDSPTSANNYMIGIDLEADMYVDGNYVNCYGETTQDQGAAAGSAKLTWDASNLIVLGDGVEFVTGNATPPPYSYTRDPAANVPTLLRAGAGHGRL